MKKRRWVAVFWEDIVGVERPWLSFQEALEVAPAPMVTLGLLLHQNKHYLLIASTLELSEEEGQIGSVCCIPRGAVQSIVDVPVPPEIPDGR